jgi:membrane-bound lytic murein transglycosylase D
MLKLQKIIKLCFFASILAFCQQGWGQDADLFPRPAAIEPAIKFWTRVYTEVDTQSGFLHDSRHLSVVYQSLPLNRPEIESNRSRIQDDLKVLASGKRSQLTQSQQHILDLWPDDVSNEILSAAASNVRWQLGQADRFLAGMVRSGAYRSHIAAVVREKNLPPELAVLPHVESSFNPGAYSSASAAGMWQFGRATGQRFMRIDHIVDDRMDPYTATFAAMSLLEYNYSILGTWPLALTAYNHGAGGMARAKREMGTDRIEEIIENYQGRSFGFASRNFYPQFLAVIDVENNAEQYFGDVQFEAAPDFVEVETDAFIDAEVFAQSIGLSLEQLRADNRGLRPVVWEGGKRIPLGYPVKVRRTIASNAASVIAQIPDDYKFPVQTPDVSYIVAAGDSLSVIANRFNTSVSRLASINQLASRHRIQIGQRLLLPQDNITSQSILALNNSPQPRPGNGIYNVRRGDTVSVIAARFEIGEEELLRLNSISDPHRIYPGQELKLVELEPALVSVAESRLPLPSAIDPVAIEIPIEASSSSIETGSGTEIGDQIEPITLLTAVATDEELLPPAAVLPDNQELDVPVSEAESDAVAVIPGVSTDEANDQLVEALAADPSDYSVASNRTIEIQASETLGHYADWLGIRARDIRRLNSMTYSEPVIIGERLQLDFADVTVSEFEVLRRDFHLQQQQRFFGQYSIAGVERYQVAANDNIGSIARRRFSTPIWLLRQYNPNLDFSKVQIGQEVVFPLLEPVD